MGTEWSPGGREHAARNEPNGTLLKRPLESAALNPLKKIRLGLS